MRIVLKQCGHVVMILRWPLGTPAKASLSVATFCSAITWNRNSFPARRAGSPVQVSPVANTPNFTPAVCSMSTTARVVARPLSS